MIKLDYSVPKIKVKFTSVEGDTFEVFNDEFGGDVISLTTNKSIDEAAGSFSLTMVGRDKYDKYFTVINKIKDKTSFFKVFRPTCLVDIYINDIEVMLGVIDEVERTCNFRGDKPIRTHTIAGRDLGSLLIEHKIWYDSTLNSGRFYNFGLTSGILAFGAIGGESPANIIMEAFNKWFVRVINQKIPGLDNDFKFADGQGLQDKLIAMAEDKNSYDVRSDRTVENNDGSTEVEEGDILATVIGPGALSKITYGNYYPIQFSIWNYEGDIMNFLKSFVSSPFNEIYVETGGAEVVLGNVKEYTGGYWNPTSSFSDVSAGNGNEILTSVPSEKRLFKMKTGKAYLVFRPAPYDDEDVENNIEPKNMESLLSMQDLIQYDIDDSKIVEKKLKIGRNNIPSFYHTIPASGLITGDASRFFVQAEYDEKALRRYGYNPMEVKLDSFNISTKNFKDGGVQDICTKFQKKLKSWYRFSDKYIRGTFVIKGDAEIRIGNRLNYKRISGEIENEDEEGKYYIRGVTHTYSFGEKFETTLTVDRGTSKNILEKGEN